MFKFNDANSHYPSTGWIFPLLLSIVSGYGARHLGLILGEEKFLNSVEFSNLGNSPTEGCGGHTAEYV